MHSHEYRASPFAAVDRASSAGRWTLVFTRDLRHPVETVWPAITDPEQLQEWAAGWHICLGVADALMAGVPFGPVVGTKAREYGWDRLDTEYAQSLGIDPAQVWTPSE